MAVTLEPELRTFEKHLQELREHHEGQFVLVEGSHVAGAFTTFEEAYEAGVKAFGTGPFLVKQVQADEWPVQFPALHAELLFTT